MVGVLGPQLVEGVLVELANIGRQEIERRVVAEFAPTRSSSGLVGQGIGGLLRAKELRLLITV